MCGSQCSGLINSVPLAHLSGKWIVTHSDQALPAVLPEALIALHIKLFISTSRGLRPHLGSNYKAARGTGVCHASQAVIYWFCLHLESELSPHLFPSSRASWLKASVSPNSLLYYLCGIYWAAIKNRILWVLFWTLFLLLHSWELIYSFFIYIKKLLLGFSVRFRDDIWGETHSLRCIGSWFIYTFYSNKFFSSCREFEMPLPYPWGPEGICFLMKCMEMQCVQPEILPIILS